MKIAVASDHGGLDLKNKITAYLKSHGHVVDDLGPSSTDSVDYPDFADLVASSIKSKSNDLGILVCGTGIGMSIRANRYSGIRAALISNAFSAEMAKCHNNANVLCFGGRVSTSEEVCNWLNIFLNAIFEGARHNRRLEKLDQSL